MESFSTRLVALMAERGMTQRDLSQASGVSQGTISKYINGKQVPKSRELYMISKALSVQMESWFEGVFIEKRNPQYSKQKTRVGDLNNKISQLKENAAAASASVERLLNSIQKLEGAL